MTRPTQAPAGGFGGNCPNTGEKTMNAQQIRDYYDSHPNVTLRQLSAMTGRSISELKCILMGHP